MFSTPFRSRYVFLRAAAGGVFLGRSIPAGVHGARQRGVKVERPAGRTTLTPRGAVLFFRQRADEETPKQTGRPVVRDRRPLVTP